jgi:hypothetical protein
MDQFGGVAQAPIEVDRADEGLDRIGEDRRLVAAAGGLFTLAQPEVGAQ